MVHTKMGKVSISLVPTLEGGKERDGRREMEREGGREGEWEGEEAFTTDPLHSTPRLTLNSFVSQTSLVPSSLSMLCGSSVEVSLPMLRPPSERKQKMLTILSHSSGPSPITSWQWHLFCCIHGIWLVVMQTVAIDMQCHVLTSTIFRGTYHPSQVFTVLLEVLQWGSQEEEKGIMGGAR